MKHKAGAVFSLFGVILVGAGALLHPPRGAGNDAAALFVRYADAPYWASSHLLQFAGVAGIVAGLILLASKLDAKGDSGLVKLARAGAVASLTLAAMLQAVEGIALKGLVDAWAAAGAVDKQGLLPVGLAVRQIGLGVASVFWLTVGGTAAVYAGIIYTEDRYPRWLACLGALSGLAAAGAGVATAYGAFSAMTVWATGLAASLSLAGVLALAVCEFRRG